MDSREQFEQWAKGYSLIAKGLHRFTEHSAYADALTHSAWQAWQASREAMAPVQAEPVGIGHCRKCGYSGPNAIHKRPKDGIKCDYMVALYPPAAQDVDKEILDNYAQMFEREHAQCQELVEALEAFDKAAKESATIIGFAGKSLKLLTKARAALAKYKEDCNE